MKELFILLLSVWFFPSVALANTNKLPERTIENVADGVIVTYIFKDPIIRSNLMIPGSYLWKYQGFGVNNSSGVPAIPFL